MTEVITNSGFFNWMMDMLRSIAGIRTPFLDGVMSGVTWLGQETAFVVIGMIVLWCVDKKYGYRFLYMLMSGLFINQLLKAIFMIPRPWVIDPEFRIVESAREGASGWSFPSGHTQSAVLLYGGLAQRIKKAWAYIVAAVLVLLVGFSRMYLGVHTLLDVGVSLFTGVLVIALCELYFNRFGDDAGPYTIATGVASALSLGLIVYIMLTRDPASDDVGTVKNACVLFGSSFGLFAGGYIEKRFVKFETKAVWWMQIIKVALGFAIVMGLRIGLKPLLALISSSPLTDCVRYFVMIFVGLAVYPLLFRVFSGTHRKKPEQVVWEKETPAE